MKKILSLLLSIAFVTATLAQTQQGVVKTRGRVVNGQVVPGTRLSGVTVTLNFGNPLVSGNQGTFSFNVPTAKTYALVSATKQGYTLADPEYVRRSFSYSAENPFYVVLEDEQQRQVDIKEATDKVRRTLKRELRQREDELDELRESNAISQARYDSLRMEFATYRQNSENLVNEMAERYASTDYDQLDEFNRQVQMYIEDGELQKADSMIRSKGNMEQRVAEYHNVVAANNAKRDQLKQERRDLEQSEKGAAKAYDDLSQDLLRRSEIFLQAYKQDSALYCLKLRADLDTTNEEFVFEFATLAFSQKEFESAINYFNICLSSYQKRGIFDQLAVIYINLGNCYLLLNDYKTAEEYVTCALNIIAPLAIDNPVKYKYNEYKALNNLAYVYIKTQNYGLAEKFSESALDAITYVCTFDKSLNSKKDLANTINNIGTLLRYEEKYDEAKDYFHKALALKQELFLSDSIMCRPDLALAQTTLGVIYFDTKDFESSIKYYSDAIRNYEILVKQNPSAFLADLALVQNQIAPSFAELAQYDKSENYMLASLNNYSKLLKINADVHRPYYMNLLINLAYLNEIRKEYDKAISYYKQAIEQCLILYNVYPHIYASNLYNCYINIANILRTNNRTNDALIYYEQAYQYESLLYELASDEYKEDLSDLLNIIANVCIELGYKERSLQAIEKAISLMPNDANFYDSKGEILLKQGKNDEALEMWKKVLELNPDYLKDYPEGTNLSNGLKKLGMID